MVEEISPEDELYRRIFDYYYLPKQDRIASSAFMKRGKHLDPEVSVHLVRLTQARELLRAGRPNQLLAILQASVPMNLGLEVRSEPEPEFPGHCVITRFPNVGWKELCDRLASASRVVAITEDYDPKETE